MQSLVAEPDKILGKLVLSAMSAYSSWDLERGRTKKKCCIDQLTIIKVIQGGAIQKGSSRTCLLCEQTRYFQKECPRRRKPDMGLGTHVDSFSTVKAITKR